MAEKDKKLNSLKLAFLFISHKAIHMENKYQKLTWLSTTGQTFIYNSLTVLAIYLSSWKKSKRTEPNNHDWII